MARTLAAVDLAGSSAGVRDMIADDVLQERVSLAEVFRVDQGSGSTRIVPVVDITATVLPRDYSPASAAALGQRTVTEGAEARVVEQLPGGGNLIRSAVPIRSGASGPVHGVIIASEYLTSEF